MWTYRRYPQIIFDQLYPSIPGFPKTNCNILEIVNRNNVLPSIFWSRVIRDCRRQRHTINRDINFTNRIKIVQVWPIRPTNVSQPTEQWRQINLTNIPNIKQHVAHKQINRTDIHRTCLFPTASTAPKTILDRTDPFSATHLQTLYIYIYISVKNRRLTYIVAKFVFRQRVLPYYPGRR